MQLGVWYVAGGAQRRVRYVWDVTSSSHLLIRRCEYASSLFLCRLPTRNPGVVTFRRSILQDSDFDSKLGAMQSPSDSSPRRKSRLALTRRKKQQEAAEPEPPEPSPDHRPLKKTFLGQSVRDVVSHGTSDTERTHSRKGQQHLGTAVVNVAGSLVPQPMKDGANFSMNMLKRKVPAKAWFLIHPDSAGKLTWDVIGLLLLLYTVMRPHAISRPRGDHNRRTRQPSRCRVRQLHCVHVSLARRW